MADCSCVCLNVCSSDSCVGSEIDQFLCGLVLHDVFRWFSPLKPDGFSYSNSNVRRSKVLVVVERVANSCCFCSDGYMCFKKPLVIPSVFMLTAGYVTYAVFVGLK